MVSGSWLFGSARELQRDQLGTYERALRSHGSIAHFRVGPPRVGFEFDAVFHPDGARAVLTSRSCIKDAPAFTEFSRLFGDNLAFGGGPRTCVGAHLAMAELVTVVAAVLRAYRLRPLDDAPALEHDITLRPRDPLRCALEPVQA